MKVPHFRSNWSNKMFAFLIQFDQYEIMENAEKICQSWGDKSKVYVVEALFNRLDQEAEVFTDQEVLEDCLDACQLWVDGPRTAIKKERILHQLEQMKRDIEILQKQIKKL